MIKVDNLCKIYKSNKKKKCKALDNINLILGDKGLVFVLGKSGSGKSTLLNLIGGLDNITSGNVYVDSNDISNFNEKDYANYRNTEIGFIFQDYHLIDELTVEENILFSLNLQKKNDNNDISKVLEKVDLAGYEDRYPSELSGGEQQRVAIARAIIKKPRIILADEPTGNLDNNTSLMIVKMLKEISKECLIIIVSHSTNDAYKYADRIIELSKGKIIKDVSLNSNYNDELLVDNNVIYYPKDKVLTDDDIKLINTNHDKDIVKREDKYLNTQDIEYIVDKKEIKNSRLSFKYIFKFCLKFLNTKYIKIFLSSFMSAVILTILLFALSIVKFDSGYILSKELALINQNNIVLEKSIKEEDKINYQMEYRAKTYEQDIQKLYEAGYKGKIYNIYSHVLPITTVMNAVSKKSNILRNGLYVNETVGTIIVDDEYLQCKFGQDGKVNYLAVNENWQDNGVIITDYVADSILNTNPLYIKYRNNDNPYKKLLGIYSQSTYNRAYINAIIDTDYETKYEKLINIAKSNNESIYDYVDEVSEFSSDVYSRLGLTYSLNENFIDALIDDYVTNYVFYYKIKIDDKMVELPNNTWASLDGNLKDGQIMLSCLYYNERYGTNYNANNLSLFKPHKINIKFYYYNEFNEEDILVDKEVEIVGLYDDNIGMKANKNLYDELYKYTHYSYALLLDGLEGLDNVIEIHNDLDYEMKSLVVESLYTMTKAVDVFVPIFELVATVLCVGVVFILVSFSTKMIKDKYHEIGVMKALGAKNHSIFSIFGIQIVLISILTIIMSIIGYAFFIDIANDILIESLHTIASSLTLLDLEFLYFRWDITIIGIALIIVLSIISLLLPFIKIKNIKPVKIIKARE